MPINRKEGQPVRYRWLWAAAAAGMALTFGGLGWDIYRHVQDPALGSREGVFPLSDPAYIILFTGTALMAAAILGVALVWLQERPARPGWLTDATHLAMFPLVGLAAAGAIWVVAVALDTAGHTHADATGMIHVPDAAQQQAVSDDVADATTTAGTVAHVHDASTGSSGTADSAEGDPHTHGAEVAVTSTELAAAASFVAQVKADTAKYADIKTAMADGYIQITQDLPGIAAHFEKPAYMTDGDIMDPQKPEFLLYTKRLTGQWQFIGVMFYSEKVTANPPSYFGPLDAWHYHTDLCFTAGAQVSTVADASKCPGGVFVAQTAWQMHVWVLPNVNGVFAHDFAPIDPGPYPPATLPAAQDLQLLAKAPK